MLLTPLNHSQSFLLAPPCRCIKRRAILYLVTPVSARSSDWAYLENCSKKTGSLGSRSYACIWRECIQLSKTENEEEEGSKEMEERQRDKKERQKDETARVATETLRILITTQEGS